MKTKSRYRGNKVEIFLAMPDKETAEAMEKDIKKFLRHARHRSEGKVEYEYEVTIDHSTD